MKKRILIYTPANIRNVEQQSQGELLIKMGYEVFLLTMAEEGPLHENCRELGIQSYSSHKAGGRNVIFFLNQARFLSRFCKEHKIDYVFSHSQGNAFITGLAHFFIKPQTVYFRHNSDYYALAAPLKYRIINKLANKWSPFIVAPSRKVRVQLIKEGVAEKRIGDINYCYNFSHYFKNTRNSSEEIRTKYKSDLLLLMVSRLDPLKRHLMAFEVVKKLVDKGVDCKLVSIGDGPVRENLQQWITENKMASHIFLESFQPNTSDYYQACDALIHLSYSEASCNVTKEAALCDKPVIVCNDVGDFDEYMVHMENAFVVNKENPVEEAVSLLCAHYLDKSKLTAMGKALHAKIAETFSLNAVEESYQKLFTELKQREK